MGIPLTRAMPSSDRNRPKVASDSDGSGAPRSRYRSSCWRGGCAPPLRHSAIAPRFLLRCGGTSWEGRLTRTIRASTSHPITYPIPNTVRIGPNRLGAEASRIQSANKKRTPATIRTYTTIMPRKNPRATESGRKNVSTRSHSVLERPRQSAITRGTASNRRSATNATATLAIREVSRPTSYRASRSRR